MPNTYDDGLRLDLAISEASSLPPGLQREARLLTGPRRTLLFALELVLKEVRRPICPILSISARRIARAAIARAKGEAI